MLSIISNSICFALAPHPCSSTSFCACYVGLASTGFHVDWQDFYNLVDVYLDAVLHPRCINDEHTFAQEGWHYELEDPQVCALL